MSTVRLLISAVSLVIMGVIVFFEISFNPVFELPREVQRKDREQEARFTRCMEDRDAEIHRRAFDTIDNPDVQREFISSRRDEAERDCRKRFPERTRRVEAPFRFKLIDIEPRFGRDLSY